MLRQVLKFLIGLGVAAIAVIVVRAYAFTIYTVPSDISPVLRKGDRVMVNKVDTASYHRGDLLVFDALAKQLTTPDGRALPTQNYVGQVTALPGDTITLHGQRYLIPLICCRKCGCIDCKLYLVNTGGHSMLVHKHQVIGRATKLFHLPF